MLLNFDYSCSSSLLTHSVVTIALQNDGIRASVAATLPMSSLIDMILHATVNHELFTPRYTRAAVTDQMSRLMP
jgi:hypothetical protein